jgi:type I restriction enzyme S subunit
MSRYKPYPTYKESGAEWLGRIPEHWALKPFKACIDFQEGPGIMAADFREEGIPLLRVSGVQGRWASLDGCNFLDPIKVAKKWSHFRLNIDDLLISASASMGTVCEVAGDTEGAIAYTGLIRLRGRPGVMVKPYVRAQVVSSVFAIQIEFFKAGSTIQHFGPTHLSQMLVVCPPIDEQQSITAYIDRETARIDGLVVKKNRFIELLREKRQALITHAVTKGLNPKVTMKNSGVGWLGEVPEHWETKRVAAMFREVIRPGQTDLPVLSISIHSGISDDELSAEERDRKVSLIEDREKYKRVCPGDLAYNMMRAWQGGFGAVAVDGLVSPAYVVAEPRTEFCTEYVELLLRTPMAIEEMRRFSRGIADFRMRLYWEAFRDVVLLSPPVEEQQAIIETIKREGMRIDALVSKTECSISLLKERRSALITAAVTGQIDLREAV